MNAYSEDYLKEWDIINERYSTKFSPYCPNCDGPSYMVSFDPEGKAVFQCSQCKTVWNRPGNCIYIRDEITGEVGFDPLPHIAGLVR